MVASLKFESAAGTATAALDQVKIIILEDGTGNKYTLDTTANNLKVAYTPNGGQAKEYTVDGLAAALGKLLTIDGSTAGKSVLAEEVAKKPVVEAIFNAQDLTDPANPINVAETKIGATFAKIDGSNVEEAGVNTMLGKLTDKVVKTTELPAKVADKSVVDAITASADFTGNVYTKTAADTAFVKATDLAKKVAEEVVKQPVVDVLVPALATGGSVNNKKVYTKSDADTAFAKVDASNLTDAANQKAFAEAILPAKDGQKSILVEKLGGFLDAPETPYGAQGNQATKDFLGEKGLKPTPTDVATELIANAQSKKDLADEIAGNEDLYTDLAKSTVLQNGLKEKLIADQTFKAKIKTETNANDKGFQGAVKAVMSQPESKSTVINHISADDPAVQTVVRGVMSQDDSKKTILSSNDPVFKGAIQDIISQSESKSTIFSSSDPIFKGAVQDVISQEQSNFEIPEDPTVALSWD